MQKVLRSGSTGPEVTRLQTMLNQVLKPVPPLRTDGAFGPKTHQAVTAFQQKNGLQVDGVVGPKTWEALENKFLGTPPGANPGTPTPPAPTAGASDVVEEAVKIALSQDGVMEDPLGSNSGVKVDAYNKSAGAPSGSFWCMSFVYWCHVQAATKLGKPNPMPKTAYCPFLYDWGKKNGKLASPPQRGDIFLVKGGPNGHKHTGLVTGVNGGSVTTIEGNTNNDGSHNGIGVFVRTRTVASCDFVRLSAAPTAAQSAGQIAWGAKVSPGFKAKVVDISKDLGVDPSYLMACMAFETGETFSPSIRNAAGSGATGLIQFMPKTATGLGTSTAALAGMTAEAQLDYVKKYFQPYKGRLRTLEDVYLAILYPASIGKPADSGMFKVGTKVYEQNKGFDTNKDGTITPAEVSAKVRAKYTKGMGPGFVG
jgi:peptidoglycan hydrolase-like protein with peptidoglycan-binding domain